MINTDLKHCPYCGEEILAVAKKCKHCGEWLSDEKPSQFNSMEGGIKKSLVTIHGYDERFAVNPSVSVYKDGVYFGEIPRHGQLKIEIEDNCALKFSCGPRSASININKGIDTHVLLSFDRFTGSLKAVKSDDRTLSSVATKKEKDSNMSTMWSILAIGICFVLWLFIQLCIML